MTASTAPHVPAPGLEALLRIDHRLAPVLAGAGAIAVAAPRIVGAPSGASRWRISSLHGPVAFTTTWARTAMLCRLAASSTSTPVTRPPSRRSAATGAWFSTTAPASRAAITFASVRRASSVEASKYRAPPRSASRRSMGSASRTPCAFSRSWRATLRKSARAS